MLAALVLAAELVLAAVEAAEAEAVLAVVLAAAVVPAAVEAVVEVEAVDITPLHSAAPVPSEPTPAKLKAGPLNAKLKAKAGAAVKMATYRGALSQAMEELAKDPRVVFLGQGCIDPGTFMSDTLQGVPENRRIELPVFEECQLGMSIGLAVAGLVPVTIFPR